MDWSLLHRLNDFTAAHDSFEDAIGRFVGLSEALFAGLLVALFLAVPPARRALARRAAVSAGASTALALLVGHLLAGWVGRPRPYLAHPDAVHLFTGRSSDPSFPSDHATAAFAIAMAIWLRNRTWGAVVLGLAGVLALGRVALGLHYPSDVVAGALLGIAAALVLFAPPLRRRLDQVADAAGAAWDALARRAYHLATPRARR
jgi:undecaprenyl-diphosphatase